MLKNRVNGCHGNHAFFHSAIEFIFEDKNSLHFWGPNERFGTHEKLSWGGCKVGQISSRGIRDITPKRGITRHEKKYGSTIFFMRNLYVKFQNPSIHLSKLSNFTKKWQNQSKFQNSIFLLKGLGHLTPDFGLRFC